MTGDPDRSEKPPENLPVLPLERGSVERAGAEIRGGARAADVAGAFARNTRAAYAADWRCWEAYCAARGRSPQPADPELVRDFLVDEAAAGRKVSVLRRRLAAISTIHRLQGAPFDRAAPVIAYAMKRLAREHGTAKAGRAELMTADIEAMLRTLPPSLQGIRDRSILLLGFASGLRRSELVGLDVADIAWRRDGISLGIRRSKTDQEGEGQTVDVVYGRRERTCPVRAVKRWLEASGIVEGPIFRPVRASKVLPRRLTDEVVYQIVKACAARAGLDPVRLGAHSLRVGHLTQALANGADPVKAKEQLRHRRLETTLEYNRRRSFEGNTSGKLGL